MNCFNHPELASVGVCQECQKGLCNQCASKYTIPICSQCNRSRKKAEKSKIYRELLLTFGIGLLFACWIINKNFTDIQISRNNIEKIIIPFFIATYGGASTVAGWKTLNGLNSNYFLFLPIIGWLIYFSLKLWLSGMIGLIVLPIRSFKNIRRLNQLKNCI